MTTRREIIGMGGVAVVAIAIAGRYALAERPVAAPIGNFPVDHTDAQWRARLSPANYHVLREAGTEKPFSSPLLAEQDKGVFACAGCANPVFRSDTKYDSHTGWPSFWQAIPDATINRTDRSFGSIRTEVLCKNCGSHLGHQFNDGPKPTGLRYCMNGMALTFEPSVA